MIIGSEINTILWVGGVLIFEPQTSSKVTKLELSRAQYYTSFSIMTLNLTIDTLAFISIAMSFQT